VAETALLALQGPAAAAVLRSILKLLRGSDAIAVLAQLRFGGQQQRLCLKQLLVRTENADGSQPKVSAQDQHDGDHQHEERPRGHVTPPAASSGRHIAAMP